MILFTKMVILLFIISLSGGSCQVKANNWFIAINISKFLDLYIYIATLRHIFRFMRVISGLTDKGHINLLDLRGSKRELTCIQQNFFHQDKYQYFTRNFLNHPLELFINPCKEFLIPSLKASSHISESVRRSLANRVNL